MPDEKDWTTSGPYRDPISLALDSAPRTVGKSLVSIFGLLPKSVRESLLESYHSDWPETRALTRQYLHPEEDVLPKTKLRPQSLTKFQDQEFRSMGKYRPKTLDLPYELRGLTAKGIESRLPYKTEFPPNSARIGLRNATESVGKDPETGKYYMSIFDSWDFDPDLEPAVGGGKPFNVYDRYNIPLDEKGRFPDKLTPGDIELLKEESRSLSGYRRRGK